MGKPASAAIRTQREATWRNRLVRFSASKLTVEAFCRRESVPVGTFYGWQARLRARDAVAGTVPRSALVLSPVPFLDLGAVNSLASRAASPVRDHAHTSLDIRLDLGGGVVLHIARH